MSAKYLILRTTKGFRGATTRYLSGRGGWTDDHHLAKAFDSFPDAQVCLGGRGGEIVRADLVKASVASGQSSVGGNA